jgi:hypothetical protein
VQHGIILPPLQLGPDLQNAGLQTRRIIMMHHGSLMLSSRGYFDYTVSLKSGTLQITITPSILGTKSFLSATCFGMMPNTVITNRTNYFSIFDGVASSVWMEWIHTCWTCCRKVSAVCQVAAIASRRLARSGRSRLHFAPMDRMENKVNMRNLQQGHQEHTTFQQKAESLPPDTLNILVGKSACQLTMIRTSPVIRFCSSHDRTPRPIRAMKVRDATGETKQIKFNKDVSVQRTATRGKVPPS